MNRCKKCNIEIHDETMYCPVCKSILEGDFEEGVCRSKMYPDVSKKYRLYRFILKLVIFASLLTEGILIVINFLTYNGLVWSAITGGALFYLCFTMAFLSTKKKGHREIIVIQAAVLMVYMAVVDYAVGFSGWSYGFAMPIIVMLIELGVFLLMIFNKSGWQNYILLQIFLIFVCAYLFIMYAIGKSNFMVLSAVAAAIAVMLFVGTLMFGDTKASNELKRRFRI